MCERFYTSSVVACPPHFGMAQNGSAKAAYFVYFDLAGYAFDPQELVDVPRIDE